MAIAPKKVTKPKTMPKAKVTKSRGSNTAKQVGDMNQREAYNLVRERPSGKTFGKVSKAQVKQGLKQAAKDKQVGTDMGLADTIKRRNKQRAGGKGK